MKAINCIGLSLIGYCVHRLLVLDGSLPLMFDANEAEYGFFRAVLPYVNTPIDSVIWHPHTRGEFLNACRTVGNQMHGSLGFAGFFLLWVLQVNKTWMASTWLLKGLALCYSTLGLAGWLIGLWRALPLKQAPWAICCFGLLYTFSPPVFTKISLLHWGTHELASMLLGLLMTVFLPWIIHPSAKRNVIVRGLIFGIIISCAPLFNYALLLPVCLFGSMWFFERMFFSRWLERIQVILIFVLGCFTAYEIITQILGSGFLFGLGFPKTLPTNSFLMLAGKQGQPFLSEGTSGFHLSALFMPEAWSDGMQWLPGPAWGPQWSAVEQRMKMGLMIFCGLLWICRMLRGKKASPLLRLGGVLGTSWILGWCAITILCLGYSIDGGAQMGVTPRYYTLLYPIGFAALSCGIVLFRRWGLLLLLPLLSLGIQDSTRYIDFSSSARHYDASRLYFEDRPEPIPQPSRIPFASETSSWRFGYGLIMRFQYRQYWTYHTASEKYTLPVRALVTEHRQSARNKIESYSDFEVGMRFALETIYPDTASNWLDEQLSIPK